MRFIPIFFFSFLKTELSTPLSTHVQRTFARISTTTKTRYHPGKNPSLDLSSLVTGLLIADLTDLIRIGCSTLSTKLSPPPNPSITPLISAPGGLSDLKLLERLNEIWLFFYTGILPQLEAVFWVLRCDDRLRAAVGGTGLERSEERGRGKGEGRIEVRRIALIEFRDGILHPEMERLVGVFERVYAEEPRGEGGGGEERLDIRRSRSAPKPPTQPADTLHPDSNPLNRKLPPPLRQLSSPARLSPDSSPSNSPTASRKNTFQPTSTSSPTIISTPQTPQSLARRLQMILILKGLLTYDDRQGEMDRLIDIILSHQNSNSLNHRHRHRRRRRRRDVETSSSSSEGSEGHEKDLELEREDEDYLESTTQTDSPRIVFDEAPLPRSQSRSNSRSRLPSGGAPRRSFTGESSYSHSTSGYASPILSTSPTEGALDLSGLGYALSRVREEPGTRGSEGESSSDGLTPTASSLNLPSHAQASTAETGKPNRRRSLFGGGGGGGKKGLLGRSNSNSSQKSQEDGDVAVPGVLMAGSGGGGEKLRRNLLLRRNSSRNSTNTLGTRDAGREREREMNTVLGGKGLSMEDD